MPRIIITEPGKSPQPYRLKIDREVTNIGRGSDNDITIDNGSASTHHCTMKRVPGGFVLEDAGSTNGIKLDDTRFAVIDLVNGCSIKIGDDVELEFNLTDEEIELLESEDFESQQRPMLPKTPPESAKDEISEKKPVEESTPTQESDDDEDPWTDEVFNDQEEKESTHDSKPNNLLVIIIIAIIAFALGFALRHYQDVIM